MLIALFLIPLLAYLLAYRFLPKFPQILPLGGAVAVALISLLTVILTVSQTSLWTNGQRVVWTGVKSHNQELTIGGTSEIAGIGWANNAFAPKLKGKIAGGQVELNISGGGGFVRNDTDGQFLNGEILKENEEKTVGPYVFAKHGSFFFWVADTLTVSQNGTEIMTLDLPATDRARVYNLDRLVEKNALDLTPTGERKKGWWRWIRSWFEKTGEAQAKAKFEAVENLKIWAQGVRLLKRDAHFYEFGTTSEVRILTIESAASPNCELPCRFSVWWVSGKVVGELAKADDNRLVLQYLPPMRNFSPLPPAEAADKLVVTDEAWPGEFAYVLPLGKNERIGSEQEAGRAVLDLGKMRKTGDKKIPEPWEEVSKKNCSSLPETVSAQLSCQSIRGRNQDFIFSLLEDFPGQGWMFILLLIALGVFGFGLLTANEYLSPVNRWAIFGLSAAVWNFLMFRLLLAIRYAIDPAYLDSHSVSDVTFAFIGLGFMPGFLLLLGRLRCDEKRELDFDKIKTHRLLALVCTVLLFLVFLLQFYISRAFLWKNLPDGFLASFGLGVWILFGGFFVYLILHIVLFYGWKAGDYFDSEDLSGFAKLLKFAFLDIWNAPQKLARTAREAWSHFTASGEIVSPENHFWKLFRLILLFLLFAILLRILGITELFFTQIIIPIYLCGVPVLLWLAAKSVKTETDFEKPPGFYRKIALICVCALLVPFSAPLIVRDAGSVYAYLAAFIPLVLILLKRCGNRRLAILPATFVGFLILAFIFLIYNGSLSTWLPESVAPRIWAFREGRNFQHQLLASDAGSGSNDIGLDVTDITHTYQHLWENQAIAHEGGWLGFGFGKAPVRLSQVRQDTIQYDSVFSFFIVGDYGLVGGIFLLLMYAVPLVLIFMAARERCDSGYALALVIAAAFLIEGLTHAAMNLWVVPLTGRNVPLLSVHSFKGDFLRWLVFFGFVVNAMFWRYREDGKYDREAVSILSDGRADEEFSPESAEKISRIKLLARKTKHFILKPRESWRQAILVFGFPLMFFTLIIFAGIRTLRDADLRVFDWDLVKRNIEGAVDLGIIKVEQEKNKQEDCPKLLLDSENYKLKWANSNPETTFLAQQINRFNALSCEERIGRGTAANVFTDLSAVKDFQGYEGFLNKLRQSDAPAQPPRKPFLLMVERTADEPENNQTAPFVVRFNPAFNIRRTFHIEETKEQAPEVAFSGKGEKLLGPAWVKGEWKTAFNPNPKLLSWTEWMADSMSLEWERLPKEKAQQTYGEISLDQKLQTAALEFIDKKGIQLHAQTIGSGAKWNNKLPPRIGLTVLKLSGGADNGATLALGSFPRAVSGSRWQQLCYGDQKDCLWLPPAEFVEKRFPSFLRQLYNGDRNFENTVVMGSTTKPIWASAVLAQHANLNLEKDFKVSGGPINDMDIFGIKITDKAWTGHGSGAGQIDFNRFLTESNNRYQVLFGFLGLAQANDKEILTETNFTNNSGLAIMKNQVWQKTPRFAENINFSPLNPQKITDLENTGLARQLRKLFGIGTFRREDRMQTADYSFYLNSFWTKNEADDLPRPGGQSGDEREARDAFPPTILPARVNFKLNRINEPRDLVTWLLGGGENRWSNVQIAAAFGSCVTGRPILPHIVKNDIVPTFTADRESDFTATAKKLRPGLQGVIFAANGTARGNLPPEALSILTALENAGFEIYAKTGTLETENTNGNTTRLLLAIVRFDDPAQTKIKNGMVFSIFAQQTEQGTATRWLGEFLMQNKADIFRLLGYAGNSQTNPSPTTNKSRQKKK